MSNLWKEVTSWLSEATRSAVKETEDLALRGRLKLELLGINTALQEKFAALGGVVYDLVKKGGRVSGDAKVKKLAAEITELEARLRESKRTSKPKQSAVSRKVVKKRSSSRKPSPKSRAKSRKR